MKFFRKYDLVLPPAALLYGIFVWNMKYPGDELVQIMDNLINGWFLITVLFAALSAGIVYQLQQNKKQQYIYSLPWTKKDIYQKSLTKLHISLLFAEIIYGIFFAMKIATIPNAESITNVIICTLWNAVMCFTFCALIQISLIVTVYIWQGLIIAVATFYVILPMILQNLVFLLQLLFKVRSSRFAILEWVIYGRFGRTFLYPLNYQLDANILDSNPIWKAQYLNSAIICIVVLFAVGVFSIWFAKRQFIKQDQAQNRMLTRLSEIQNKVVTTIVITILCFNALSNHEIYVHIFKYDETLRTRIYGLIAWGKEFMCLSDSYKLIIQKLNAVHWFIYLVVILVITYFAVSIIQTIRRKCYERAC